MKAKVTTSESQSNLPLFWVHQGTQQMNAIPGECKSGIRLLCIEFCPPTKKKKQTLYIAVLTPSILECDLTWDRAFTKVTELRWGH